MAKHETQQEKTRRWCERAKPHATTQEEWERFLEEERELLAVEAVLEALLKRGEDGNSAE